MLLPWTEVTNVSRSMPGLFQIATIAVTTLGAGVATVSVLNPDLPDYPVPDGAWVAGTSLDGRAFEVSATIAGTDDALPSTVLTFDEGGFQSSRCQVYCEFGWQPYETWTVGDTTHFAATTRCPDAPHTVVWYGTVTGDTMTVEGTWTTRRWYWTRQIALEGVGSPVDATDPVMRSGG